MTELLSHPHLRLSEHISQIQAAMAGIFQWHSPEVITTWVKNQCELLSRIHDLGKGTLAFQEYIKNPCGFKGNREEKSHTALSCLITILLGENEKWEPLEILVLSAIAKSHHSQFSHLDAIREALGGCSARLLKKQMPLLMIPELEKETGFALPKLACEDRPWARAQKLLDRVVIPKFQALNLERLIELRLQTQLLFSILLEADKTFLAVPDPGLCLPRPRKRFETEWIEKRIELCCHANLNDLRSNVRKEVLTQIKNSQTHRVFSLTAPTGIGKTMLAATWAFEKRLQASENGQIPKIIVVLPFLSIIDQTIKEYKTIFSHSRVEPDGSWFIQSHSLSDRLYSEYLEENVEAFFIDTWRTELVITTYDQFLFSLMNPSARHQMRFHNLCDALIIIDEVQSLPCCLWKPLESIVDRLSKLGNARFLFMSATLPGFIKNSFALLPNHESIFQKMNRYSFRFSLDNSLALKDFLIGIPMRVKEWDNHRKRVLMTFNTRSSARKVRDCVAEVLKKNNIPLRLFFLTADVAPCDRQKSIEEISTGYPCIVISTQCIEAGVDIDMDLVIRDFAPLDSLIQVAGRCNRHGNQATGVVEVVDLLASNGKRFSEMIYNSIHLEKTWKLIRDKKKLEESEILPFTRRYFQDLTEARNLGDEHLERFAQWKDDVSVKSLLRGFEQDQITFLIGKLDRSLLLEMEKVAAIRDRWKRREGWRKLAGRIAKVSIHVYPRKGFEPSEYAKLVHGHWVLRDEFYESDRGLHFPEEKGDEGFLLL